MKTTNINEKEWNSMYLLYIEPFNAFISTCGSFVSANKLIDRISSVMCFNNKKDAEKTLHKIDRDIVTIKSKNDALALTSYYGFPSRKKIIYMRHDVNTKKIAAIQRSIDNRINMSKVSGKQIIVANNDEMTISEDHHQIVGEMKKIICHFNNFEREVEKIKKNRNKLNEALSKKDRECQAHKHLVETLTTEAILKKDPNADVNKVKVAAFDDFQKSLIERRAIKNQIRLIDEVLSGLPTFDIEAVKDCIEKAKGIEGQSYKCREKINFERIECVS